MAAKHEASFVLAIGGYIDAAEHDVEALEEEFVEDVRALVERWRHHVVSGSFTGQAVTHDLSPATLPDVPDRTPMTATAHMDDDSAVAGDTG